MGSDASAYSLPPSIDSELARLQLYWKDLIRGENSMPFSDDINLSEIPELESRILLMQAFENPERFRFEQVGERIGSHYDVPLKGLFADEIRQHGPLEDFVRQCSATTARSAPTYFRSGAGYERILLPTWGEGHVQLLLGAVARTSG